MNSDRDIDIFRANPFYGIRNTGFFKQRKGWIWESCVEYACLYCVAEGEITLTYKDSCETAERGDVIVLRSSDRGALLSAEGADCSYYFLSFYYDEGTPLAIGSLVKSDGALELFKKICRVHHSEAYLYKLKTSELFLSAVHQLCLATAVGNKTYKRASGLRAAVEYVNTYYYKRITIGDLCAISNYSPSHLRRLFTENYGVSPREYIINKKLSIAAEMITDAQEKPIEEIAELLSFCSASYLCKLFKKRYGVSILGYKRANDGQAL